jgi:hypothetical protein
VLIIYLLEDFSQIWLYSKQKTKKKKKVTKVKHLWNPVTFKNLYIHNLETRKPTKHYFFSNWEKKKKKKKTPTYWQ